MKTNVEYTYFPYVLNGVTKQEGYADQYFHIHEDGIVAKLESDENMVVVTLSDGSQGICTGKLGAYTETERRDIAWYRAFISQMNNKIDGIINRRF